MLEFLGVLFAAVIVLAVIDTIIWSYGENIPAHWWHDEWERRNSCKK